MVNDKLIKQDRFGNYSILFSNRLGIPLESLYETFGQFGKVLSIKPTGDAKSFHFVRYESVEETYAAIAGVENHEGIRLVEHKPRAADGGGGGGGGKRSNFEGNKSEGRNGFEGRNNFGNNRRDDNRRESFDSRRDFGDSRRESFDSRRESFDSRRGSRNSERFEQSNGAPRRNRVLEEELLGPSRAANDNFTSQQEVDCPTPAPSVRSSASDAKVANWADDSSQSLCEEARATKSAVSVEEQQQPPGLVDSKRRDDSNEQRQRPRIIPAEEVVVGNVHPVYGAAYLLHLFQPFEPLAVSEMSYLPKGRLNYCCVYFKSVKEALEVERRFDQIELCGQRLLVLRRMSLEAAAGVSE